jgi:queuosine precursor transporter
MLVVVYLTAVVAANLLTATFGPGVSILNAFLFIGLDLTTRDALHERWKGHLLTHMGALIAAGSFISWALNRNAGKVALASLVAFGAAALVDAAIYHLLRKRRWMEKANGSNVPAAAVDSLVFPTIAFGGFLPGIVLAQFVAKVLGGFVWSFAIGKVRGAATSDPRRQDAFAV